MLSKARALFCRQLDVTRPVSRYVPAFGREGKAEITLRQVLTHRSGVIIPHLWDNQALWPDWGRVQEVIWDAQPRYRPGTLAYHPYEFGWILGEVVRRIAGQPLDRFLADVLPVSLQQLRRRREEDDDTVIARSYWLGPKEWRFGGRDVARDFAVRNNARRTLTSLVPGASLTATASALAKFYEMLLAGGTTADGIRLIRSSTLERYLTTNVTGFDRMLRSYLVLGRGFQLGWLGPHPYGWWDSRACVAHGGGLCAVVFGDRRIGAAIAVVTNGNRGFRDVFRRSTPLSSAIRKAVACRAVGGTVPAT